jgi:hypothetical protein
MANTGYDSSLEVLNHRNDITLNPCSQKIKEPGPRTYPKPHILCMFLHESQCSLKIFKNPKLEVLLSLNIMKKIGGFHI